MTARTAQADLSLDSRHQAASLRLDRFDAAVRILGIATRVLLAVMAALVLISKVTG